MLGDKSEAQHPGDTMQPIAEEETPSDEIVDSGDQTDAASAAALPPERIDTRSPTDIPTG